MLNALLLALTLSGAVSPAQDEAPATPRARTADTPGEELTRILRVSRRRDGPPPAELREQSIELGEHGIAPAISILLARSVPALDPSQTPQALSEPQTEILLTALEAWPARPALELVEHELVLGATLDRTWAAIAVWSAVGGPEHLERAFTLAAGAASSRGAVGLLEKALERGVTRLLRRRPEGHAALAAAYPLVDTRFRLALLLAVGATGDSRASELFSYVLAKDPEHAPAALAQTQLVQRSHDPRVHAELCAQLRERLRSERPNERSAALRALGVQRDGSSVQGMIELLEDEDETVRRSAEWSLNHATRLSWRDPRAWRTWHAGETAWRDARQDQILQLLRSNSPRQVTSAVDELAQHPLFASETALWVADLLQSERVEVRVAAARALGQLDSPLGYPALIASLADPELEVVVAAHRALVQISGLSHEAVGEPWRAALLH